MTHKFGPDLFKMTEEAIAINEKNRNTLWQDAIEKEIKYVKIAFQIIPEGERPPNGNQYSTAIWCLASKWRIS